MEAGEEAGSWVQTNVYLSRWLFGVAGSFPFLSRMWITHACGIKKVIYTLKWKFRRYHFSVATSYDW